MAINRSKHRRVKFVPPPVDQPPSEAQVEVFFNTFEEVYCEYDARKVASISREGLAKLKEDPAFVARLAASFNREEYRDRLMGRVRKKVLIDGDKDLTAAEARAEFPERYGAKASLTLTADVTKMTVEELEEIVRKHGNRS